MIQRKHLGLCSWHSSCFMSSGKCARSAVSLLLILCTLFSFALPASAAEGESDNPDLQTLDVMDMYAMMYTHTDSPNTDTNYADFSKKIRNSSIGEIVMFTNNDPKFYQAGRKKITQISDYLQVKADTHYNLKFSTFTQGTYYVKVVARVYSGSSVNKDIVIYNNRVLSSNNLYSNDFDFILHSSDLGSSYRVRLIFEIISPEAANTPDLSYQISRYITLQDLDSNAGWFQKIINTIKAIPDKLKLFFTQLGDRISDFFTDLKNSIVEQFNNVKQWFIDLGNTIKQKFTELGDRIHVFFVDLKNDIIDGLKKLFIPEDGYFEQKKKELEAFCLKHFGALYQAPQMMINFIKKFTTISPKQPSITLPAIEFNFQGHHYVLTHAITYSFAWVNDSSHMLYYFYKFYRGFVVLILFMSFGNYCVKKYNEVFAGGDPD